jgi:hypothetical protein
LNRHLLREDIIFFIEKIKIDSKKWVGLKLNKATITSMSVECNCPFCPLVENKLNACDIRVLFKWKKNGRLDNVSVAGIDEDLKQKLATHLITLCLFHRNNHGLKKGEAHENKKSDYEYYIESLPTARGIKSYDLFKICFHTKKQS